MFSLRFCEYAQAIAVTDLFGCLQDKTIISIRTLDAKHRRTIGMLHLVHTSVHAKFKITVVLTASAFGGVNLVLELSDVQDDVII